MARCCHCDVKTMAGNCQPPDEFVGAYEGSAVGPRQGHVDVMMTLGR